MKGDEKVTMISVIIPVYNGAEFLEECLCSVIDQSYRDLEIIVIDDGSTDNSYAISEKLALQDSRIRLSHQENAGVSAARNHGLSLAVGDYVLFVDADDLLPKEAVSNLLDAAAEADLVIGSYEEFRHRKTKSVIVNAKEISFHSVQEDFAQIEPMISMPWGKLYRRSIIADRNIRFDTCLPYGEDAMFNLRYCKFANIIRCTDDIVYRFRKGGLASSVRYYPNMNSISVKLLNGTLEFFDGRENIPQFLLKKKVRDHLTGSVVHYMVHCPYKSAIIKTEETLSLFAPFIEPNIIDSETYSSKMACAIMELDGRKMIAEMYKEKCMLILARKIKVQYYGLFGKRI